MEIYISREGWYPINMFNQKVGIPLTGLTMEIYISREGWYPINRFNHGDLYVKRGLVSH